MSYVWSTNQRQWWFDRQRQNYLLNTTRFTGNWTNVTRITPICSYVFFYIFDISEMTIWILLYFRNQIFLKNSWYGKRQVMTHEFTINYDEMFHYTTLLHCILLMSTTHLEPNCTHFIWLEHVKPSIRRYFCFILTILQNSKETSSICVKCNSDEKVWWWELTLFLE